MIVSTKYKGELTAEVHGEFMAHVESQLDGILPGAFNEFAFDKGNLSVRGGIAFVHKTLIYISTNAPESVSMNVDGYYAAYIEYNSTFDSTIGINYETASIKTKFDSSTVPSYPTGNADTKILPLYIMRKNGSTLATYRDDRTFLKTPLYLAKAEIDKLTASDIEGTDPSGKGGENVQTIMDNIYAKIIEATAGDFYSKDETNNLFYSKLIADGRFKRIIDINSEFSDSEFTGMNMAQIMVVIKDYVGNWGHTYEIVAECTNTTFPNVRDAMRNLVNEIFKTSITTSTLKFKMNRARRSGAGGCDILEVGFDNGPIYYMQYDNYGDNWATVNADVFAPLGANFGITNVSTFNASGNAVIDGKVTFESQLGSPFIFTGTTLGLIRNILAENWVTTGVQAMRLQNDRTASSSADWKTYFTNSNVNGDTRTGFRMQANEPDYSFSVSKSFAYASSFMAKNVATLETQVAMQKQLDLQNAQIQALVNNETVPTEFKMLKVQSKELLLAENELQTAKAELDAQVKGDKEIYLTDNIKFTKEAQDTINTNIAEMKNKEARSTEEELDLTEMLNTKQAIDSNLIMFEDELAKLKGE